MRKRVGPDTGYIPEDSIGHSFGISRFLGGDILALQNSDHDIVMPIRVPIRTGSSNTVFFVSKYVIRKC